MLLANASPLGRRQLAACSPHTPGEKWKKLCWFCGFFVFGTIWKQITHNFYCCKCYTFFFLCVRQPLISCMSKTTPPLLNDLNSSLIRLFLLWEASRFLSPIYSYRPCGRACYCDPRHCFLLWPWPSLCVSEGEVRSPRPSGTFLCLTSTAMLLHEEEAPSLHPLHPGCSTGAAPCCTPRQPFAFPVKPCGAKKRCKGLLSVRISTAS